jgi:hypothetical protein
MWTALLDISFHFKLGQKNPHKKTMADVVTGLVIGYLVFAALFTILATYKIRKQSTQTDPSYQLLLNTDSGRDTGVGE